MFESFPTLPSVSITIQELKYTVPDGLLKRTWSLRR